MILLEKTSIKMQVGDKMELTFGEKIKLLRENADINQTKLGKACHMSQQKISKIECGSCEPRLDDIKFFCRYFNVTADYLLGFSKNLPFPKRNTKI